MRPFHPSCMRPAAMLMLLVAVAILPPGVSFGQNITVSVITAPVNTLTFADINLQNATSPKYLFTVTLNAGGATVQATMEARLDITLATGEQLGNPAARITTDPFTIKGSLVFTNLDLGKGRTITVADSYYDEAAKQRLQDVALPSGALPAGRYHFTIDVKPISSGNPGSSQFTIILTNPSSVDLVFPADGDPAVSPLPLFQWRYDGASSRLSVFEKLIRQGSLEEATEGTPILQTTVNGTTYQYPSAGVRSLQPGKTYVWYVEGLSNVTGSISLPVRSELRSFNVAAAGMPSYLSYLDDLERALDPKYKPVFDQIRADGLQATGRIKLNGSAISTVDLLKIIQQLRENPDGVLTVGLDQ
jgi:hypothetical protein